MFGLSSVDSVKSVKSVVVSEVLNAPWLSTAGNKKRNTTAFSALVVVSGSIVIVGTGKSGESSFVEIVEALKSAVVGIVEALGSTAIVVVATVKPVRPSVVEIVEVLTSTVAGIVEALVSPDVENVNAPV